MNKKSLLENDVYAIINQMEVSVSKSAEELMDLIVEKKARAEQKAYDSLKSKVESATGKMISNLTLSEELELEDNDLLALGKVTDALRHLGYKFRFIEVQDTSGETLKHKLLVSVEHLA